MNDRSQTEPAEPRTSRLSDTLNAVPTLTKVIATPMTYRYLDPSPPSSNDAFPESIRRAVERPAARFHLYGADRCLGVSAETTIVLIAGRPRSHPMPHRYAMICQYPMTRRFL
jgi:hypothetical protein